MAKKTNDPLKLIKADHEKVKSLFEEYDGADYDVKKTLSEEILKELSGHMEMEESLFYPKIEAISDDAEELISEARREHEEVKEHLEGIKASQDEESLDMHMKEMEEGVLHHIEEEEDKIFSLAKDNLKKDFKSLSEQMLEFKEESE